MKSGIYHVQFKSSAQSYGEGLAVFKEGTVNGGDHGYLYLGTYEDEAGGVSAKLKIRKWNQGVTSVFGPFNEFDLILKGSFNPDLSSFTVAGVSPQIPGASITIFGRRVADAV